jgi:Leucine-rich repeat (LRR) protein
VLLSTIIPINADVPFIIQCALEYDLDFKLYSECHSENSCILADLKIEENSSAYEVNRTQIHEFECLIFTNSFVQKIPSNIFIATRSKIAHLYANNVSVSELLRNSFLIANQLETVDLSWNALQELHETAFYDASNLLILNLSHNKISEFSSNVFEKLDKLETLDLSFNQISSVPFELFQPLRHLATLNLRENRLQLKFGTFPESIRTLDLSYNNLEFQQKFKIFALLKHLETFLLHGNWFILFCLALACQYYKSEFKHFLQ